MCTAGSSVWIEIIHNQVKPGKKQVTPEKASELLRPVRGFTRNGNPEAEAVWAMDTEALVTVS